MAAAITDCAQSNKIERESVLTANDLPFINLNVFVLVSANRVLFHVLYRYNCVTGLDWQSEIRPPSV